MPEATKAHLVRVYDDLINAGNLELADQLVAVDHVDHQAPAGTPTGREGFKGFFAMLRAGFPDLNFTVEVMLAEGDLGCAHVTIRGTHEGNFMGIAPTGKKIEMTATDILRVKDGQTVEHWGDWDLLGLRRQLGAA